MVPLWADGVPAWFPPEFGWVVGCSYTGQPERTAPVRNPIGANMSFRREPVLAVGGFRVEVGRVGADALGGEETELSIRLGQHYPGTRILHEPAAVVHHHVPADRGRWAYYRRRCWAEGVSKAQVRQRARPSRRSAANAPTSAGRSRSASPATSTPRSPRATPLALVRAGAIVSGLALTVGGYATATARTRLKRTAIEPENTMQGTQMPASGWLNFDVHGKVGIRVAARAPGAPQLQAMLACFATDREVPADILISEKPEPMPDAALLERELAYTEAAVRFVRERVQVILEEEQYRVHGAGELLDLARAGARPGDGHPRRAMIHAATVAYNGQAIALPAAGGTGKTSTVAKLMRREGWTFMGDDWAFLSDDAQLLGYEKPMFIKPHHKAIYPHLFEGARKPLVPVRLSRGVGRVTTVVHPYVIRYPRVADFSRRWSPEHMMVTAEQAFPGRKPTTVAPLAASVYIERFEGARSRLVEKDPEWMVDRMLGNFHIEMAGFSQQVVTGLAASSVLPWNRLGRGQGDGAAEGAGRPAVPPAASPERLHPGRGLRRHRGVPRGAAALVRRRPGVVACPRPSPRRGRSPRSSPPATPRPCSRRAWTRCATPVSRRSSWSTGGPPTAPARWPSGMARPSSATTAGACPSPARSASPRHARHGCCSWTPTWCSPTGRWTSCWRNTPPVATTPCRPASRA